MVQTQEEVSRILGRCNADAPSMRRHYLLADEEAQPQASRGVIGSRLSFERVKNRCYRILRYGQAIVVNFDRHQAVLIFGPDDDSPGVAMLNRVHHQIRDQLRQSLAVPSPAEIFQQLLGRLRARCPPR